MVTEIKLTFTNTLTQKEAVTELRKFANELSKRYNNNAVQISGSETNGKTQKVWSVKSISVKG